jgi:hypothetical protein
MLMQNIKRGLPIVIFLLVISGPVWAQGPPWRIVHGEVCQVLADQHTLLLAYDGQGEYLALTDDCLILREGQATSLESLRPIGPDAFQDALCWVNPSGLVELILVNYYVEEENGALVSYDIFGNRK